MTQADGTARGGVTARIGAFLAERRSLLLDYVTALSGSAGRLVFSLLYFVALANALSLADFGLFATASAAGVMLSRLFGFGFISALYRTATVRPRLIGLYSGGFLMMALLSLPTVTIASLLVYGAFFAASLSLAIFATIIVAEVLLWRNVEAIIIVNNGSGRFARASVLSILGIALRAVAAVAFFFVSGRSLAEWSVFYLVVNGVSLALACLWFYPGQRLRIRPALYWRRLPDSLYVAAAELLFYLQMEFDKLLVLAIGGPHLAGIYAILMRLIDLTAIPIRTFNMMLVQKMMRTPDFLASFRMKLSVEAAVFAISTTAVLGLSGLLFVYPRLLGGNVAEAAPLLILAVFIPGFRNLVEYQAELLFGRGQTLYRAGVLAILAALKGALLYGLLVSVLTTPAMIAWLNLLFAALYLASALLTYAALRRPARRV